MIQVRQDLWSVEADVRCVTTNGTVMPNGANVMGGGCAREAAARYPGVAERLGALLAAHGNHVYLLAPGLVSFPTKDEVRDPSTRGRIHQSVCELYNIATHVYRGWNRIALPRPGCGLGGLSWDEVYPLVEWLDDRFILVDFPNFPKET